MIFLTNFILFLIGGIGEQFEITDIIDFATGVFAAVLLVLSLLSYRNVRAKRLLFVSAAFGLYSIREIILARLDYFVSEIQTDTIEIALSLAGFVILALIFLAIVKKS